MLSGISSKETGFSWTSGDAMFVEVPVSTVLGRLNVKINIVGTFEGSRSYVVKQENVIISEGSHEGAGVIEFDILPDNNLLRFEVEFPDAQVVSEVDKASMDNRKLAFQIQSIEIQTKGE